MGTVQTVPCPSCQHPIAAGGFKNFVNGRGAVRARYIGGILAGRLAEVQQNRFIQNLGQPHKEMG